MVVLSANETLFLVIARGHAKIACSFMKGVIFMKKGIITYDVFDIDDKNINIEYFKYCARAAKKCGVFDTFGVDDKGFPKINLRGRKFSMVQYYFKTIFKSSNKLDGIKRLVDIILT